MNRFLPGGVAVLLGLTLLPSGADARRIAITPIPHRIAMADVVVIGKVGKVEEKNVSAIPSVGVKDKVEFQVVALKIDSSLVGLKDVKEIRVGYLPAGTNVPGRPGRGGFNFVPMTDQEGVFFLNRHPEENFYVAADMFPFLDKKTNTYEKDLDLVKSCAKMLADPTASLKAKDEKDRLMTVALLLTRYRTPKDGQSKTEAIDAAESKLILQAIADADWNAKQDPNQPFAYLFTPQSLFFRLGLTDKDGFGPIKPNATPAEIQEMAKNWLKDNIDKYRIQRYVAEKK